MTCKTKLVKGHFIPARWRASKISEKASTAHFCAGGEGGERNTSHSPKQNVLPFSWFVTQRSAYGRYFPRLSQGSPAKVGFSS